ncbi:MAG: DUF6178 family protein [Pseudomonadota bacterium]
MPTQTKTQGTLTKPGKSTSGSGLLRKLIDQPQLPALIPRLPSRSIGKMIDRVGLDDSTELVALTSPQQLAEILDERLWVNKDPGRDEVFSLSAFLNWCEILLDVSEEFAADRLVAIGESWLLLGIPSLATVIDLTEDAGDFSTEEGDLLDDGGMALVLGDFQIIGRGVDEWDVLYRILATLWERHPDFSQSILRHCSFYQAMLNINNRHAVLAEDIAYDRSVSRQKQGFVTPLSATLFLTSTRETTLDMLLRGEEIDSSITAMLATMRRVSQVSAPTSVDNADEIDDDEVPTSTVTDDLADIDEGLREIDTLLREEELEATISGLLEGPDALDGIAGIRQALRELGSLDLEAFERCMQEVVFLSNILLAGTQWCGRRMTEEEASEGALACVALGLDWVINEARIETDRLAALSHEEGVARLFRIGWRLISELPEQAMMSLCVGLYESGPGGPLRVSARIYSDVAHLLSNRNLMNEAACSDFAPVKSALSSLSMIFGSDVLIQACTNMELLVDPFPGMPDTIADPYKERLYIDRSVRFIDSLVDLSLIEAWLRQLPEEI